MRIRKSAASMVLCLIMVLSACGSWQKTGVTTYASLQIVHDELGKTVNRMYSAGVIKQEDYVKIELEYNKAAVALYQAGDAWSDIIDYGSLSRQEEYQDLILKVEKLMDGIFEIIILYGGGY